MPKQKVTIQDIATKANVSMSTVSRVLSGNAPVAEAKRQAVLDAIAALDYRPNVFAQGLASGHSMTIGVLTQNVSSPFNDTILRGVLTGLNGSNYSPIFADGYWIAEREQAAIRTLLDRRIDGLIVLGGESSEETLQQISQQVPLIVVGRDIPSLRDRCLRMDDFQGAYRATNYLIELGHRKIAHITGVLSHQDAEQRRQGYIQALTDAGVAFDPGLVIEGDYLERSGVLAVEMLMTRGVVFSAIFAANDQMAYGVRLALYRRGLRVPDDISIVGFDDQASSAYMTPPLTTIQQPAQEMGETAARAMLSLLKDEALDMPLLFPAKLIVRESAIRFR